jgi:transposase
MTRFISGENRSQSTLFPEALDDYIHEDNPVRVVDVFVDTLNFQELGFTRSEPKVTGRPAYAPATMLKLYLYGYLNRIQSSRRLERESQRNIELMWLIQRLKPDFKTIADFRKNNAKGIKNVCRTFIELCRQLNLFTDAVIAVDGSKFKAVNSVNNNFTQINTQRRIQITEQHIADYLSRLDTADQDETIDTAPLKEKIALLKTHLAELETINTTIQQGNDKQVSLTDPDCRTMKPGSIGRTVGYNVQTAVDTKHHLIVAHYVTNDTSDRDQLSQIGQQAQAALHNPDLTVLADKGYYSGIAIKDCQDNGMTPLVPKTDTSGRKELGMFCRDDFKYNAEKDVYICPNNRELPYSFETVEAGKLMRGYLSVRTCKDCTLKPQCTTGKARRIKRWEHEECLERMESQLLANPKSIHLRKCTVEHPFGTIKSWMGATHFLTKRLPNVNTEMSLHVLAYNLKRLLKIMGQPALMDALRA